MKKFLLYGFYTILCFNAMLIGGLFREGFGGYIFFVALILSVIFLYLAIHHWLNWEEKSDR